MEIISVHEFRYPLRTARFVAASAGAVFFLMLGVGLVVGRRTGLGPVPWPTWPMPASCIAISLLAIPALIHEWLRASRAFVEVSVVGLTVCNWRGRERSMAWHEVDALTVADVPLGGKRYPMFVQAGGRQVRFDGMVDDPEGLVEEIIGRAGLTEVEGQFGLAVAYTRPAPSPDTRQE